VQVTCILGIFTVTAVTHEENTGVTVSQGTVTDCHRLSQKWRITMFEGLKAQKADVDTQLADFVALYARFAQDTAKCGETPQERGRMRLFAARVDAEWQKIPEAKREILAHALLAKKLLPEELRRALQVFKGKVVSVI